MDFNFFSTRIISISYHSYEDEKIHSEERSYSRKFKRDQMQRLAITLLKLRKKIRKMLFKSSKGMMNLEWRVRNYWIIYFATTYFSVLYWAIADIRKQTSRYNRDRGQTWQFVIQQLAISMSRDRFECRLSLAHTQCYPRSPYVPILENQAVLHKRPMHTVFQ